MEYTRYGQLIDTVKGFDCSTIVEVGTHKGNSALRMINASIERGNLPSDVNYYGFDLFELMTKKIFEKEVSKWAPSEAKVARTLSMTGANIKLYKGFSRVTIPLFAKENIKPDIVFIDGGHSIETLENDWRLIQETIDNLTVVIFDDYITNFDKNQYGCNDIIDSLDRNLWDVEILPEVDVINDGLSIQFARVMKK